MNNTQLIGRLTTDLELRSTSSGVNVTTFTLAVPRKFNRDETDFINCVAWRNQAENLVKYCGKGSRIAVTGRIETRNYEAQDGTKRYVTEVIAESIEFLDTKKDNIEAENNTDPFDDFSGEVILTDDDLPF